MKTIMVTASIFALLANGSYAQQFNQTCRIIKGLNIYCDQLNTIYMGGSPLFNEVTGRRISKSAYLKKKGLNIYCDPVGTVYTGGTPLYDESTGMSISLEEYLKQKEMCL